MAIRTDFIAGEVLAAADLNDTFDDARENASNLSTGTITESVIPEAVKVPVGTILETLRDTAPTGYELCQGQTLTNAQTALPLLWAALPATFKSGSNIILPDLSGRVTIAAGTGSGLTARVLGATGGAETHTLTVAQIPSHTHLQNAHNHGIAHTHGASTDNPGDHQHLNDHYPLEAPADATFQAGTNRRGRVSDPRNTGSAGGHTHGVSVDAFLGFTQEMPPATNQNTGGGESHNNVQPFLVVNKMIRVE
jgi:microcystin-dependent protein